MTETTDQQPLISPVGSSVMALGATGYGIRLSAYGGRRRSMRTMLAIEIVRVELHRNEQD